MRKITDSTTILPLPIDQPSVVSLRRLNNTATRVIPAKHVPAKHVPAKAGSRKLYTVDSVSSTE